MKKLQLIIILLTFTGTSVAQNSFYVGYENGIKFDKFFYVNSKGYSLTQMPIDGVFGGYVGYKLKRATFETGFYGYYTSDPFVNYDYETGIPGRTSASSGSSGMDSWVIPLRFGYEFLFAGNKLFLKPEISFIIIFARDYSSDQPTGGWGQNVSPFPGDTTFVPKTSDSTRAYDYRPAKVSFGMETSLSFGYRFKQRADIYLKGTYSSSFTPLYYNTITHYSATETVTATNTFTGNSFLFQIGLRFYFSRLKE
ncbi:MAG: hypothetical protein GXO86_06975 [Chlorobi bacterium]|nr:hypothetical protein [Chlorobiota bacterium]